MTKQFSTPRVLLVEDDADLRSSLTSYLSMAGLTVTGVGSCRECYAALPGAGFQVAVVDVALPDQSGLVLTEYLRANTDLKIILLTARERLEDRLSGYAAGAHNYFVKPVDARELLAAIISLASAETAVRERDLPYGPEWRLRRASWHLVPPGGEAIQLTALEQQLLELLVASPGRIVARDTLLTGLYQRSDEHSGRALDSLVRRLRNKIAAAGHTSPIKTAHAVGFCFAEPIRVT